MANIRQVFYEKFSEILSGKREDNCFYLTSEKYDECLNKVLKVKKIKTKERAVCRLLKRYDVLKTMDHYKLIVPVKMGNTKIIYYVKNEEIFDIVHEAHIQTNHGGRTRMIKELQKKYKNITYEVVMLYLGLCVQCKMKQKFPKNETEIKPPMSGELDSHCQMDLLDMQTCPDGEFKFIFIYQDHMTKFIQLRPLKTNTVEEVAHNLLSIILIFGAPNILNSNYEREFTKKIITELHAMWPEVKILDGKSDESEAEGFIKKINHDIQNGIRVTMEEKNVTKWSEVLPFVQFTINSCYHQDIEQTPHEALFGKIAKKGLSTSSLPHERVEEIETEEQLEQIIQSSSKKLANK